MSAKTAKRAIDIIFETPSRYVTLEFQGGEPLANWETVKFATTYARKLNRSRKKNLLISLVTNLSFMTDEKLKFIVDNDVAICTSLDGPAYLHKKTRFTSLQGYKKIIGWIRRINQIAGKHPHYKFRPNALTTVTKDSLTHAHQIVDTFFALGLEGIHLRPVNPFCIERGLLRKLEPSAGQFLQFYRKAMDYIISINLRGKFFYERTARILLSKILLDEDPNYLDIRSPCGAGIGQLAYNFNGDVYTCDEARMLSTLGDLSFRVGNVYEDSYEKLVNNDVVKTICTASCLDNVIPCQSCVYKPYCGVCPIYNFSKSGNLFTGSSENQRCKILKGTFDYLFALLKNKKTKTVLMSWVKRGGEYAQETVPKGKEKH